MTKILMSICDWYMRNEVDSESNQVSNDVDSISRFSCVQDDSNSSVASARISKFKRKQAAKECVEIKKKMTWRGYLLDACKDIDDKNLDILNWWRVHRSKHSTLSKIARDVLGIQVSTAASKCAFSTGGRILDPFHSSLNPRIVDVLVSSQNWLKASPNIDRFFMEDVEYYNKLDEEPDE